MAIVSDSLEQPMIHLTTVDLNDDNLKRSKDGDLYIKIAQGEVIVLSWPVSCVLTHIETRSARRV